MRLYLIRHGDPDYKNDSLTEAGHLEAAALAERLAGVGLTRLFCSPLGRARKTMEYTAKKLSMEAEILPWTRELDLNISLPGTPYLAAWDVPGEKIRATGLFRGGWADFSPVWPRTNRRKIKAVYAQVAAESDLFFARWGYVREKGVYRIVKPNRQRLAVFCHGGFGLTWLAHLLNLPLAWMFSGFFLPPTSVTTVLFDERTAETAVPRCIGLGDISHLHAAGLPMSASGIKANVD